MCRKRGVRSRFGIKAGLLRALPPPHETASLVSGQLPGSQDCSTAFDWQRASVAPRPTSLFQKLWLCRCFYRTMGMQILSLLSARMLPGFLWLGKAIDIGRHPRAFPPACQREGRNRQGSDRRFRL